MKQISFTVKNLGGNLPEKQFTVVKRNFRSSTKLLSLDSTNLVDELTAKTFYRSQYVTNSQQVEEDVVGCKVLHFINNKDQEALGYKTLRCKDVVTSCRENKALGHFLHVFSVYNGL